MNAGSIYGASGDGVALANGGGITNQSGGTISGVNGIYGGSEISVVNAGSIAGQNIGAYLAGGGTVTNLAGGSISGLTEAVKFAAGHTNRLIIQPGATFGGFVDGGNALGGGSVSTLELASASGAGTISGLGSQYLDFAQITIDAGAAWTLSGEQDGFSTLANAGSILNGLLLGIGPFTVSNQSTGTISGGIEAFGSATVTNAGYISASGEAVFSRSPTPRAASSQGRTGGCA